MFAGPHWTLLGQEIAPDLADSLRRSGLHLHLFGAQGDLIDVHGHFQAAYGLERGELVLVRPDGYIAAVVASAKADALDAYMRSSRSGPRGTRRYLSRRCVACLPQRAHRGWS